MTTDDKEPPRKIISKSGMPYYVDPKIDDSKAQQAIEMFEGSQPNQNAMLAERLSELQNRLQYASQPQASMPAPSTAGAVAMGKFYDNYMRDLFNAAQLELAAEREMRELAQSGGGGKIGSITYDDYRKQQLEETQQRGQMMRAMMLKNMDMQAMLTEHNLAMQKIYEQYNLMKSETEELEKRKKVDTAYELNKIAAEREKALATIEASRQSQLQQIGASDISQKEHDIRQFALESYKGLANITEALIRSGVSPEEAQELMKNSNIPLESLGVNSNVPLNLPHSTTTKTENSTNTKPTKQSKSESKQTDIFTQIWENSSPEDKEKLIKFGEAINKYYEDNAIEYFKMSKEEWDKLNPKEKETLIELRKKQLAEGK